MRSKVFAVILGYNGRDLTLGCLESLKEQDYADLQVILVDNGSQDDTVACVQARYPDVQVIVTGKNLGYTGGNNFGMRIALDRGAELLFLLNNDTVLERTCISKLASTMEENPEMGAIGPMVYTWGNWEVISSAGGKINWQSADAYNLGAGESDTGQYPAGPVDFINGCGIMVAKRAVEKAGMLDEQYFMYWEETDWCQRIKKSGLGVFFDPSALMQHKAPILPTDLGPTTIYYVTRNRLRFFAYNGTGNLRYRSIYAAVKGAARGIYLHRRAGRIQHAKATQIALIHAAQNKWGRLEKPPWS